jgi:hypothetical protein
LPHPVHRSYSLSRKTRPSPWWHAAVSCHCGIGDQARQLGVHLRETVLRRVAFVQNAHRVDDGAGIGEILTQLVRIW